MDPPGDWVWHSQWIFFYVVVLFGKLLNVVLTTSEGWLKGCTQINLRQQFNCALDYKRSSVKYSKSKCQLNHHPLFASCTLIERLICNSHTHTLFSIPQLSKQSQPNQANESTLHVPDIIRKSRRIRSFVPGQSCCVHLYL